MDTLKNVKTKLDSVNKNVLDFINAFVDEKSFVQTDAFMCSDSEFGEAAGEGVVSGFAAVSDTPVCIFATNAQVFKGAVGAAGAKKITRAINNAVRMEKPLIAVWDSSGARIAEGIDCLEGYGSILRAYSLAYGEVPVISVIKGNNLGISSYISGMSDFVLAYPDSVTATSSPLVISAKTGKSEKDVGSAASLAQRGIVTNIVKKDELRATITKILTVFSGENATGDDLNRACKGLKAGSKLADVIKQVFDKDSFLPLRDGCAPVAVTGFASLGDTVVGVVGTDGSIDNGRLTADACVKISEFLNVCETVGCPVVFLTDSEGVAVCDDDARLMYEMSNMIYQINSLDLDMFSVVTGKAIGAAYTALVAPCEYKIAWESAQVGALGSEAAARLMYADEIKQAKNKDKAVEKLAVSYAEGNLSALTIAKSGHFDNVIEPELTRSYLLAALIAHVE